MIVVASFKVSYKLIDELNLYFDQNEITNVSIFEDPNSKTVNTHLDNDGFPIASTFCIELYCNNKEEAIKMLENVKQKIDISDIKINTISDHDWIEEYEKNLHPIIVDNFVFYYSDKIGLKKGQIGIKLGSSMAFGNGSHQTTKGCILSMLDLKNSNFSPKNILDMGCGSGILAICASKIWSNIDITCTDIDINAVQIAQSNCKNNNVKCDIVHTDNLDKFSQTFDLIVANILKQPLELLASSFFMHLSKNGKIIISGYIREQEKELCEYYTKIGFQILNTLYLDDWCMCTMQHNTKSKQYE